MAADLCKIYKRIRNSRQWLRRRSPIDRQRAHEQRFCLIMLVSLDRDMRQAIEAKRCLQRLGAECALAFGKESLAYGFCSVQIAVIRFDRHQGQKALVGIGGACSWSGGQHTERLE